MLTLCKVSSLTLWPRLDDRNKVEQERQWRPLHSSFPPAGTESLLSSVQLLLATTVHWQCPVRHWSTSSAQCMRHWSTTGPLAVPSETSSNATTTQSLSLHPSPTLLLLLSLSLPTPVFILSRNTCYTATCVRDISKWLQVWGLTWEPTMTGRADKLQCHNHSAVSLSLSALCPPLSTCLVQKSFGSRSRWPNLWRGGCTHIQWDTSKPKQGCLQRCVENSLYFLPNIHHTIYAIALYRYCSSQLHVARTETCAMAGGLYCINQPRASALKAATVEENSDTVN